MYFLFSFFKQERKLFTRNSGSLVDVTFSLLELLVLLLLVGNFLISEIKNVVVCGATGHVLPFWKNLWINWNLGKDYSCLTKASEKHSLEYQLKWLHGQYLIFVSSFSLKYTCGKAWHKCPRNLIFFSLEILSNPSLQTSVKEVCVQALHYVILKAILKSSLRIKTFLMAHRPLLVDMG